MKQTAQLRDWTQYAFIAVVTVFIYVVGWPKNYMQQRQSLRKALMLRIHLTQVTRIHAVVAA